MSNETPPEGEIIEAARRRHRLSQNKAATKAGISGTRWRQVVKGVASGGKGVVLPTRGNAETVAHMAHAVGVSPDQLAEADRDDAADVLRGLELDNATEQDRPTLHDGFERSVWADTSLSVDKKLDLIAQYRASQIIEERKKNNGGNDNQQAG